MRNLWMRLAPPSVDVSGAESVLFGLGGRLIVYDNQGCVGGVVRVDERRWAADPQDVESARLDETDIELGNDEPLVEQALAWPPGREPSFIALLGGPVSACMGADLDALAARIARASGLPALSVHTNGHDWYDRGATKALGALYATLCAADGELRLGSAAKARSAANARSASNARNAFNARSTSSAAGRRVNVLGALLLDMENVAWLDALEGVLTGAGFTVNAVLGGMRPDLDALARVDEADVNLVINAAALPLARAMERDAGVPFVVGLPMGQDSCDALVARLEEALRARAAGGAMLGGAAAGGAAAEMPGGAMAGGAATSPVVEPDGRGGTVLLVGEQVAMNGLRELLECSGVAGRVDVATLFAFDRALARPHDRRLADEGALARATGEGYACVVADNLVARLLPGENAAGALGFVALPHAPLSGRRFIDRIPALVGPAPDRAFVSAVLAHCPTEGR